MKTIERRIWEMEKRLSEAVSVETVDLAALTARLGELARSFCSAGDVVDEFDDEVLDTETVQHEGVNSTLR